MDGQTIIKRLEAMRAERATFENLYRDCFLYTDPSRADGFMGDIVGGWPGAAADRLPRFFRVAGRADAYSIECNRLGPAKLFGLRYRDFQAPGPSIKD